MRVKEITPEQLQRGYYLFTWATNKLEHLEWEVLHETDHGTYIVVDPCDVPATEQPS